MDTNNSTPSTNSNENWNIRSMAELILKIAALITAFGIMHSTIINYLIPKITENTNYQLLAIELNLLVLIVFCLMTQEVPDLAFANEESRFEYIKLLNVGDVAMDDKTKIDKANSLNERVNILVRQLKDNIVYYAISLIIVYIIFIILFFISKKNVDIFKFLTVLTDLFNYISSVFLYLAFKVLYNQTLDKNNRKMNYYMDAFLTTLLVITIYSVLYSEINVPFPNPSIPNSALPDSPIYHIKNILSLIVGIFNGLSMSLLFSRFVSMEHNFASLFEKHDSAFLIKNQKIFYYGTIFILPLYALAQPLFGDFNLHEFGDPKVFSTIVFCVCFIGKLFFLVFLYIYVKKKLIHVYFHLVITKYGIPPDFTSLFNLKD